MTLIQWSRNKDTIVSAGIVLSLSFSIFAALMLSNLMYKELTQPSPYRSYEPAWSYLILVPLSVALLLLQKIDLDQYAKKLKIKAVVIILFTIITITLLSEVITFPKPSPVILFGLIFVILYPAILLSFLSKNWYPKVLIIMGIPLILFFGFLWIVDLLFIVGLLFGPTPAKIIDVAFLSISSILLLLGFIDVTVGLAKLKGDSPLLSKIVRLEFIGLFLSVFAFIISLLVSVGKSLLKSKLFFFFLFMFISSFSTVWALEIEQPITSQILGNITILEYPEETITIIHAENYIFIETEPHLDSEENILLYQKKVTERLDYAASLDYSNISATITFSNLLSEQEVEALAQISNFTIFTLRYISTDGGGEIPYPIDHEKLAALEQEIAELQRTRNNISNFVLIKGYVSANVLLSSISYLLESNYNLFTVDVGPVEFLQLYPDAIIIPGRSLFYRYNKTIVAKDTAPPQITNIEITPRFVNSQGKISIKANVTDNVAVDKVNVTIGEVKVELRDIDGDGIFVNDAVTPPALEGNYTVNVTAFDLAGNSAYNDSVTVVVDNTPPSVSILQPANNSYIASKNVTMEWNASDSIGISRYELSVDGVSFGDLTETTRTLKNLMEGLHRVEVKAFDLANNSASDSVSFTIDTIPPEISITGIVNGSYYNTDVAADISITDANLRSASILLDGAAYTSGTAITSEGIHVLEVYADDLAGNNATKTLTFVIDKTPPEILVSLPAAQNYSYTEDITLDFTATDAISGIASISAYLDDTPVTNGQVINLFDFSLGEHAFTVSAVDNAGNNATETVIFNVIDDIPPATSDDADEEWHTADITIALTSEDEKSDVAEVHYIINDGPEVVATVDADRIIGDPFLAKAVIDYEDDNNTIRYYAVDEWGNAEQHHFVDGIKLDKTRPQTTDDYDGQWHREDIAITLNATDPMVQGTPSGIAQTYYVIYQDEAPQGTRSISVDGQPVIAYEDDDNWLEYWSLDVAGNEESHTLRKVIRLDKTPPEITVFSPASRNYSYTEDMLLDFNAADRLSGVVSITASIDGVSVTNGQVIDLFAFELGAYTLTIEAGDSAGNDATKRVSFAVIDDVSPVSSDNADKNWHNSDIVIAMTARDEKSSVKEIRYAVNQGSEVVVGGSAANATISYEGDNNTVRYYAVDEWGNAEAPKLVDGIKLDKTPPVVRLWLDPAKDEYYSDELLPVKHEAYDPVVQGTPSNDLTLIFEIDGIPVEDPTDVSNWVGMHTLAITATDLAGNSASASIDFTVILRAEVNIDPDTLNLASEGKWITAYIEFPLRYDVMSIKIDTVTLNRTVMAESDPKYDFVSNPVPQDKDGDGLLEFMAKFDRGAVQLILQPSEAVALSVSGEFSSGIFEGTDSIRVIDEGSNKSNRTALKLNKHVERRDGRSNQAGVRIDLFAVGNNRVDSVFVQEYIPQELGADTANGAFADFGLMWDVGAIEQGEKQSVEYTLIIPKVEVPTTYQLRTVVEYQTADDLETIEEITYLIVEPDGQVKIKEGQRKGAVKEKGRGYTSGNMGRHYDRGGSGGEGHGRGHGHGGRPEDPGRGNPPESPPGNPNPGPPDNPGQPDNPGNPNNPPPSNPGNPDPGQPDNPGQPGNPSNPPDAPPADPNPGQPEDPGQPENPGNPDNPPPGNPNQPENPGGNPGNGNGNGNGGSQGGDNRGQGNDKGGEKK